MRSIHLLLVAVLLLTGCPKRTAAPVEPLEPEEAILLLGRTPTARERRALEATATSDVPWVSALAVAVLYTKDAERWHGPLYGHFGIHDAKARADNDVISVEAKVVKGTVEALQRSGGQELPSEVATLRAFLEWRDRRAFVVTPMETIDVARTLRSGALRTLWIEAERLGHVDTTETLSELDARARLEAGLPAEPPRAPIGPLGI